MRLHELIIEKVLPYKRKGDQAAFKYDQGRTMKMSVIDGRMGDGQFEISFHPEDREGKDQYAADDAGGDELSVFHTVIAFVEEWYAENKDRVKMLYAEPSINDQYTGKRHALYTKLAKRMANKFGGTVKTNGQFVMWYPEKVGTEQGSNLLHGLQKLISSEQFWEELADNGTLYKSIGSTEVEFNDANLQGKNLFELESDRSGTVEINADSDLYYELVDNGKLEQKFRQDAVEFQNMYSDRTSM